MKRLSFYKEEETSLTATGKTYKGSPILKSTYRRSHGETYAQEIILTYAPIVFQILPLGSYNWQGEIFLIRKDERTGMKFIYFPFVDSGKNTIFCACDSFETPSIWGHNKSMYEEIYG